MKYYIIAGERSGDLHGSNLIKGIKLKDDSAEFRVIGGELMKAEGAVIAKNYNEMAFMGFWEVIKNVFTILRIFSFCINDIKKYNPDTVILIDYAGFNMRIAKKIKGLDLKTIYYISPKVWAWNQNRALKIKATINKMYVIFPFEVEFYAKYQMDVTYMGNPILDSIADFRKNEKFLTHCNLEEKPTIALLPGSRIQEIKTMLPIMLDSTLNYMDSHQIVLAKVSNVPPEVYEDCLTYHQDVKVVEDLTYDLLSIAELAIVTSGTATLETALFNVPQVVCYKTSWLSAFIARAVIKVNFISLVNLILQKLAVIELIQEKLTAEAIASQINKIMVGGSKRSEILEDYAKLKKLIGQKGASQKVGEDLVNFLNK